MGFLIVFSLVNAANFKLYKETGDCRVISGLGTFLGLGTTVVLIGYNLWHNPHALMTSGIVIATVGIFSFAYYKIGKQRIAPYVDKRLERDKRTA